jgi:hypothetical protein
VLPRAIVSRGTRLGQHQLCQLQTAKIGALLPLERRSRRCRGRVLPLCRKQNYAIELCPLQPPCAGSALLPKLVEQGRMHRNRSGLSLRAISIFPGLDGRCVHDSKIR